MGLALKWPGSGRGEVPGGGGPVDGGGGQVLARAFDEADIASHDPTAHAEILVLRAGGRVGGITGCRG